GGHGQAPLVPTGAAGRVVGQTIEIATARHLRGTWVQGANPDGGDGRPLRDRPAPIHEALARGQLAFTHIGRCDASFAELRRADEGKRRPGAGAASRGVRQGGDGAVDPNQADPVLRCGNRLEKYGNRARRVARGGRRGGQGRGCRG